MEVRLIVLFHPEKNRESKISTAVFQKSYSKTMAQYSRLKPAKQLQVSPALHPEQLPLLPKSREHNNILLRRHRFNIAHPVS